MFPPYRTSACTRLSKSHTVPTTIQITEISINIGNLCDSKHVIYIKSTKDVLPTQYNTDLIYFQLHVVVFTGE